MVRRLRNGHGGNGLILANGGWLTYQHAICLSSTPRKTGSYPEKNPLPETMSSSTPTVDAEAEGEAVIEVRSLLLRKHHRWARESY